jgi:hypothetical protein
MTQANKPVVRRALRIWMYGMLAIAGVAGLYVQSPTLSNALGILTYAWAIFLILGGLCGLVACITDRWIFEFAGLPLLVSALTVYGVALAAFPPITSVKVAIGALMLSSAASLAVRWRDLWVLSSAHVGKAE